MFLIDDHTSTDVTHNPLFARGCIEPDYKVHPEAAPLRRALPSEIKPIVRTEWSERIKEKKALRAGLQAIRRTSGPNNGVIPSLNQNDGHGRWGYCWAHSSTMAHMLVRAIMGLPYKQLSAFMVAAIVKKYQDQGGWGALSLDFIEKNGQPGTDLWPQLGVDPKYDTPAMRAAAAANKVTADWADINASMWERTMPFDLVATLLLSDVPVVADYNWWGHSVCLMELVEVEPNSFGVLGLNSWGDQFGDVGEFTLRENKAVPDGAVAPMSVAA